MQVSWLAFCRVSYFLVILKVTFLLENLTKGNVSDFSHIWKEFSLKKKDYVYTLQNTFLCMCFLIYVQKFRTLSVDVGKISLEIIKRKNWIHKTSQASEKNVHTKHWKRDPSKIWLQQPSSLFYFLVLMFIFMFVTAHLSKKVEAKSSERSLKALITRGAKQCGERFYCSVVL